MIFTRISKDHYLRSKAEVIVEESIYPHAYALLLYNEKEYKMSWSSDLIDPHILKIENDVFSFGVDQIFLVYDFTSNKIRCNLRLDYNFCTCTRFDNLLFINTELEIIILNKVDYSIFRHFFLPDIFENITISEEKLIVTCQDGTLVETSIF